MMMGEPGASRSARVSPVSVTTNRTMPGSAAIASVRESGLNAKANRGSDRPRAREYLRCQDPVTKRSRVVPPMASQRLSGLKVVQADEVVGRLQTICFDRNSHTLTPEVLKLPAATQRPS